MKQKRNSHNRRGRPVVARSSGSNFMVAINQSRAIKNKYITLNFGDNNEFTKKKTNEIQKF